MDELKLNNLGANPGGLKKRNRVGRGPGSGNGKTCGKGHGGQNSRGSGKVAPWFEGGQMPLQRRIPKRGFTNIFKTVYQLVNVSDINRLEGAAEIDAAVLANNGLIRNAKKLVKLLGDGEVTGSYKIIVNKASAKAVEKIEAAGGSVTIIPTKSKKLEKFKKKN